MKCVFHSLGFSLTMMLAVACPEAPQPAPTPGCSVAEDETIVPEMLTAFFGLDDVPGDIGDPSFNDLCPLDLGRGFVDGMPVVTSVLLDGASLDGADFEITTASGQTYTPECVTLAPAIDDCEGRTVLLIGEMGDDPGDPPTRLELVGEVLTLDGRDLQDTATPIDIIPLLDGPTLVLVEQVDPARLEAPAETLLALRAVWAGGIVALDDNEVTEAEWEQYALDIVTEGEERQTVSPFAIGDLDDGDNNHLLFFDVAGTPETLRLPAGLVMDPNDDPNPETSAAVRLLAP
jgi:hypothetical protein